MLAASPPIVALVVETCVTCVPFWNTRYCTVQLAPGVEALQDRLTLLLVLAGRAEPGRHAGQRRCTCRACRR